LFVCLESSHRRFVVVSEKTKKMIFGL
jgi:hypothetical protein